MKQNKTAHQRFLEKRDAIMPELRHFVAKHGEELAQSAMSKHLILARQQKQREEQIAKLEKELSKIKKGKAISPYN